jgi:glucokinase
MGEQVVLGLDLGGTNMVGAALTTEGKLVAKSKVPTEASGGLEHVLGRMADCLEDVLEECGCAREDVLAAGVGAPGPLNQQTGVVYTPPNLPGWKDVPLADELNRRLNVAVFIENDANCAAYGENWLGAGRDFKDLICLTLGTGVGGGIILNNELVRGVDGTAGEIGHLIIEMNGRKCNCGSHGCLEQYGSATGIVSTAREAIEQGEGTVLTEIVPDLTKLTAKDVSVAMDQGDEVARRVITQTGEFLGIGIASLVNLLNPEVVVLCGGVIAAGEALFKPIRETVKKRAFPVPSTRARIVPSVLGDDAGVIGAAGVALSRARQSSA